MWLRARFGGKCWRCERACYEDMKLISFFSWSHLSGVYVEFCWIYGNMPWPWIIDGHEHEGITRRHIRCGSRTVMTLVGSK